MARVMSTLAPCYIARISGIGYGPFDSEAEAVAFGAEIQAAAEKLAIRIGVYVEKVRQPEEAFRS